MISKIVLMQSRRRDIEIADGVTLSSFFQSMECHYCSNVTYAHGDRLGRRT